MKLQHPEMDHNQIARAMGVRAADVLKALQVKDVVRKRRAALQSRT